MTGGIIFAARRNAALRSASHHNATLRLSRRICAGMAGKPSNAAALYPAPLRSSPLRVTSQRRAAQRKL